MFVVEDLVDTIPPGERLRAARALIESVFATDLTEVADAALTDDLVAAVALGDRVESLAMVLAGAWEPRKTWCGTSSRSARGWLAGHTDLGDGDAGRLLRCGRLLHGHEVLVAAVRDGRLAAGKVSILATAVTANREELFTRDRDVLVGHVIGLDVNHAARLLRKWRALCDDELAADDHVTQRVRRHLHHSQVGNGWRLDGTFDLTDGAVLDAALRHAIGDPDPADRAGGQRTTEQRRADALIELARRYLTNVNHGRVAHPTATVNIHLDAPVLVGSSADPFDPHVRCDLGAGIPCGRHTARRLACDSYVGAIVFGAEREIVNFGRLKRCFTPAQKRAIIARDGPFCVVPHCPVGAEHCEAHHLDPFASGHGRTDIDDAAMACPGHHVDLHEGGYALTRNPDGTRTFSAPDGRTWTG